MSDSEFERSNAGHAHFIDVLQQAYDIFAAFNKSRITKRTRPMASSADKTPLDNLFKHLEVEDPSETQLGEDELAKLAIDEPRIKFRVETNDEQETLVQLLCLLGDIKLVREEVEATFKQYRQGEVTIEVACLVANIGFGIIRRACEYFVSQHPRFEDYSRMLEFLGLRMEKHETLVVILPKRKDDRDEQPLIPETTDGGASGYAQPLVSLDAATVSLLCASGAGVMTGVYDESRRKSGSQTTGDIPQIRHGFDQILHDAIPELQTLISKDRKILVPELGTWYSDEFASGLLNFLFGERPGLLPIWLAIAAQCYRNIHDILDGCMNCAVQTSARRWAEYKTLVKSFDAFEYCKGIEPNIKPPTSCKMLIDYIKSNEKLLAIPEDRKLDLRMDPNKKFQVDFGQPVASHLITKLPSVAGVMMLDPMLLMHKYACGVANTHLVVHSAAHLYAACRHTGLISDDARWRDMDFFLKHHSMFTDNVRNSNPFTMVSHFHLALGAKANNFAKVRANPDDILAENVRFIPAISKLVKEYQNVLQNSFKRVGDVGAVTITDAMLQACAAADCPKLNLQGKSSAPKQKVYTPIRLLAVMKEHLIDDEPARNFNMIGFSQQCSTFVEEARHRIGEALGGDSTNLRPHTFTTSVLAQTAKALEAGVPAAQTVLLIASKTLEKIIAKGGDTFIKQTCARSSGHLSPDEQPEFLSKLFDPTMDNGFNIFVHDCLGKARGWTVEDGGFGAAVYHVDGDAENFTRLAKVYDSLRMWDLIYNSLGPLKNTERNKALVDGMRGWASAGFDDKNVPPELVDILAIGLEGSRTDESLKRARQWLITFVLGSGRKRSESK
jgi:hypothetical protein